METQSPFPFAVCSVVISTTTHATLNINNFVVLFESITVFNRFQGLNNVLFAILRLNLFWKMEIQITGRISVNLLN
jgi:hypothetical protein